LRDRSSFGKNSPFAFAKENGSLMLLIDTTITAAFTFVHHVEEMEQVRYRKYKRIRILLKSQKEEYKEVECLLYAKKPGWTMSLDGLERLLVEKGIARKYNIGKIPCTLVDLAKAYPLIKEDIDKNNARNLARFSFKLYVKEKVKSLLRNLGFQTINDKISHDPGLL
jgi:aminoglycoside 3-N-acetyltransferase